jgi:hypothetical protein
VQKIAHIWKEKLFYALLITKLGYIRKDRVNVMVCKNSLHTERERILYGTVYKGFYIQSE